jgi:CBS domain-containing protein
MKREPHTLPIETTAAEAWQRLEEWPGQCIPVMDGDQLAGLVTRGMLEEAQGSDARARPLAELPFWRDGVHVHPDHPLELALDRLSKTPGVLPVVSRSDARKLEGVISLEDVLRAFAYSRRI